MPDLSVIHRRGRRPLSIARSDDQVHHLECWAEIGGCGTYGCKQAPAALEKAPATFPSPVGLG